MKKQFIYIIETLVVIFMLTGCTIREPRIELDSNEVSSKTEYNNVQSFTTPSSNSDQLLNFSPSYDLLEARKANIVKALLDRFPEYMEESAGDGLTTEFYVVDITEDGVPELLWGLADHLGQVKLSGYTVDLDELNLEFLSGYSYGISNKIYIDENGGHYFRAEMINGSVTYRNYEVTKIWYSQEDRKWHIKNETYSSEEEMKSLDKSFVIPTGYTEIVYSDYINNTVDERIEECIMMYCEASNLLLKSGV